MDAPIISRPVIKSASVITAAVGVNTPAAGAFASATAAALAPTSDPVWYWFIVSLPWDSIASFVAALYSLALLSEWIFKRVWRAWLRPWAMRRGWIKGPLLLSASQWAEMEKDRK